MLVVVEGLDHTLTDADKIEVLAKMVNEARDLAHSFEVENAKPKEENDHLAMLMQDIRNATDSQQVQSLLDLRAENAKLKGALVKYGSHYNSCFTRACVNNEWGKCSCGFDKALEGDSDA